MKQTTPAIPNKLYFRIGEVAHLLTVKPYVLRYWETEFPDIKPAKSKSGQRLYKRRDVELLLQIKSLLYGERFTINGARRRLRDMSREQRLNDSGAQVPLHWQGENKGAAPTPPARETKPSENPKPAGRPSADSQKIFAKIKRDLQNVAEMLEG